MSHFIISADGAFNAWHDQLYHFRECQPSCSTRIGFIC